MERRLLPPVVGLQIHVGTRLDELLNHASALQRTRDVERALTGLVAHRVGRGAP